MAEFNISVSRLTKLHSRFTNSGVRNLGKSLTRRCLWRFCDKLRHSIRAVSGALLGNGGLKGRDRNDLNELMNGP